VCAEANGCVRPKNPCALCRVDAWQTRIVGEGDEADNVSLTVDGSDAQDGLLAAQGGVSFGEGTVASAVLKEEAERGCLT
jgi:hypothetical protein